METQTFDSLVRATAVSGTRRSTLGGLLAGVAAVAAGIAWETDESVARRKRKKKKNKKKKKKGGNNGGGKGGNGNGKGGGTLQPGQPCQSDGQCISGYICAVPVNGSSSDLACSGAQGTTCGAPNEAGDDTFPFCAVGFKCTASGGGYTCQAMPQE